MFDSRENNETTYQHTYKVQPPGSFAKKAPPLKQVDEPLISQHLRTALQVNGKRIRSKVWPNTLVGVEEYNDFVKRLDTCKMELHKMYFACPPIDTSVIDKILSDLEKSTYQLTYSPNYFRPRKESRRYEKTKKERTNMKYYETTYGTYYNRVKELERFKDLLRPIVTRDFKEELKSSLRRIYKSGGVTTYYTGYCIPAVEAAKGKQVPEGPIDRYTLRRI